jgi:aarF domain-containing kinase
MSLFSAAKAAYDKLDKLEAESGKPGSMAEAREALHSKFAAKALALAHSQGGVYVKAAQFIASLQGGSGGGGVPAAYTSTLAALTDRAAPHDLSLLSPLIEEELRTKDWVGEPTGGATPIFARVETPAVAAASLSQVHRAQMADGTWMALKLQFPWLAEQVRCR